MEPPTLTGEPSAASDEQPTLVSLPSTTPDPAQAPAPVAVDGPALGAPGERCAQGAADLAPDQRYCLNCGWRRAAARVDYAAVLLDGPPADAGRATPGGSAVAGGVAAAPPPVGPPAADVATSAPGPGGPRSISPLGAALAAGLLLLAVLVGATVAGRSSDNPPQVVRVGGAAGAGGAPVAATAFVSDWTGDDGWTVQLQTLPKAGTTAEAVAAAKTAAGAKGATEVGALDSDAHGSLDPAQYVVFSGSFASKDDATARLDELSADFPDAKVVEVAATAGGSGTSSGAGKAAKKDGAKKDGAKAVEKSPAIKDLENASPEEYQKKSKKLPDEVGTGGTPPAKDNKPPDSSQGEATVIG